MRGVLLSVTRTQPDKHTRTPHTRVRARASTHRFGIVLCYRAVRFSVAKIH